MNKYMVIVGWLDKEGRRCAQRCIVQADSQFAAEQTAEARGADREGRCVSALSSWEVSGLREAIDSVPPHDSLLIGDGQYIEVPA